MRSCLSNASSRSRGGLSLLSSAGADDPPSLGPPSLGPSPLGAAPEGSEAAPSSSSSASVAAASVAASAAASAAASGAAASSSQSGSAPRLSIAFSSSCIATRGRGAKWAASSRSPLAPSVRWSGARAEA
eukprot:scaffold4365_cov70-Phaeocystis_antarctica.AAC.1